MPVAFVDRFTPRTSPRTQLVTAACIWTVMGCFLFAKGTYILCNESAATMLFFLGAGLALGVAKSRLIFDHAAMTIVRRIRQKAARSCLGGVFSIRNWMLIASMMLLGKAMTWLPVASEWRGFACVLVGSGLVYSSRLMWSAWKLAAGVAIG